MNSKNRPGISKSLFIGLFCAVWLMGMVMIRPAANAETPIRSGSEINYPPFCIVDALGRPGGFSVELMQAALAAMGREVAFRTGPWSEVKGWLENGEVQVLPLVGRTPERELLFDFTFPYMSLHGAIVVRTETVDIQDLNDLKGREVAVMKGDNADEFLRREDRGIEIHGTPTFEEALQELSEGRHDAAVVQRLVGLRLIQKMGLTNLKIINKPIEGFRQDFCFAVREGDRDTLALLNEGLALVMADGTYRYLHAKWFAALELPAHRRIIVGGDRNYPPYEFLDNKGRPAGYNVDLTRAIAREMGLDIEIRLGPWPEMVEKLGLGEIDALQGMFYSPKRDLTFDFTPPHAVNHCVSVVRKNEGPPPSVLSDLAGKRIVVQKGDIMHDFALENGLENQVVAVDAMEDVLRELSRGKHDCALVSRLTAMYWIKIHGWKNLTVGSRPFLSPEYGYAVLNNRKALLAEFGEGLKVLEETGEYRRISEKWMGVYADLPPDFKTILRYIAVFVIPLILAVCAFFLWSWSLRKQIKRRTSALEKSEELQRSMIACSPIALYSIDPDGIVMSWNDSAMRIFGWSRDEVIGKPLPIVPDDKQDEYAGLRRQVMSGEAFWSMEVTRRKKDGSLFEGSLSAAPIWNAEGDVIGIMSAMEDITRRKQAEHELKRRNEFIETILDSLSIGLAVNRMSDATAVYINKMFEDTYGWPKEEITDVNTFFEKVYPGRKDLKERVMADIESNDPSRMHWTDLKATGKNGDQKVISAVNIPLVHQDMMISMVQDITLRHNAIDLLKKSEEKFRQLAEMLPETIFELDRYGKVIFVNKKAYEIFLYEKEDFDQGLDVLEMIAPSDRARAAENMGEVLKGKNIGLNEYHAQKKDGTTFPVLLNSSPIYSEKEIVGLRGFLLDVSAQKALELEYHQAQKMESVGRLAGGVAHDFNNMLSVIMGYAELAMDRIAPDHPLQKDLEEILNAAMRSTGIVRQLLAFARKQTVAPKVLDLNDTVEGMLKILRRLIGEDIDLLWEPGKRLGLVKVDPSQIDQILANLCVNARDAISGVGKITIETENIRFDEDYCAAHVGFIPGAYIMLAVSDDGAGMDRETLDYIFEPFFTTKELGEGTGLGLATVYGIVKQNNGFVNVYSETGEGTCFKIYLPRLASETEKIQEEDGPVKIPMGRGETILLVEDEVSILNFGKSMLKGLGYAVLAATTPGQAMALAEEHASGIHLLVTDVVMPEMNGRELAERLQVLYPDIRVLFMSGYTADVIAHRGVLDADVHFIQKPFSRQDLAIKVRGALDENDQ